MRRDEHGWGELTVEAPAGTRYHYRIDGDLRVPDPASRYNPEDVHAASEVIDASAYAWRDERWHGRAWAEAVIYELHVGTFSPEGTFAGVERHLDYLRDLGVTAVELMPIADFPGKRNWGYDGVLPYAPDAVYGRPEDLKRLIDAAHERGLMMFLDVVYNHFGPEGNYLNAYACEFFTERHKTDWGDGDQLRWRSLARGARLLHSQRALLARGIPLRRAAVRRSACDRGRVAAAHPRRARGGRAGRSRPRSGISISCSRTIATKRVTCNTPTTESRATTTRSGPTTSITRSMCSLRAKRTAITATTPVPLRGTSGAAWRKALLIRASLRHFATGKPRGEPSAELPPAAFVTFLQNHDQIGNRALGERLGALTRPERLRAATVAWLLAPARPMLFMGEEFAASSPFLFFCDFGPELAQAVTNGRRREFARFEQFSSKEMQERIPDPNHPDTFERSRLDWQCLKDPAHATWLELYRALLSLRSKHIVPRLSDRRGHSGRHTVIADGALLVQWVLADRSELELRLNLSDAPARAPAAPDGELLHCEPGSSAQAFASGKLPANAAAVYIGVGARLRLGPRRPTEQKEAHGFPP